MNGRRAAVVAIGDLARSPRMVNHARELAAVGFRVCMIGYCEHQFRAPDGVEVYPLPMPRVAAAWSLPAAGWRMTRTFCALIRALVRLRPDIILVQNPPAFPTLLASWISARVRRAQYVIDWHNYGYSMLALRIGARHTITRWAARYESWMARRGACHLCVSQAMQADLAARFRITARMLYDRPLEYAEPQPQLEPPLVVCPSGWTADEDMGLLLDALELLGASSFELYLTGDGPRRSAWEPRIQALRARGLVIHTGFLEERDYRALLSRAILGLSLHRSSSGFDLPMKIVDLFAAGVPVCALDYGPVLRELITPGETGLLFGTAAELAALLTKLERDPAILERMRCSLRARRPVTWREEWRREALPLIREAAR